MYAAIMGQCTQALRNVEVFLSRAEELAAEKKFDVSVLLTGRLAPDMKDLVYQVQSACDYLKGGAARLSGQTPPRHEDDERTLDEVRARIRKTVAFADSIEPGGYENASQQKVHVNWAGKSLSGQDYLTQMVVPNLYFHVAMIYAILRHNGVDVGKLDFLAPINWIE